MRIPRFYIDSPLSVGEIISLSKEKAHHLSHVLRLRSGDELCLFNNSGYEFNAKVITLAKKHAEVEVQTSNHVDNESSLDLTLCLGISRGQHMDYSIQKAVELGVNKIIPLMSEFSNVKIQNERINNKMQHWQNIIISAAEQCGRNRLATLSEPVSFTKCITTESLATRIILHPGSEESMSTISVDDKTLSIVIGPEGGFSDAEINEALESQVLPVRLGPRILRAETAVVSALSNAQQLWGDLN